MSKIIESATEGGVRVAIGFIHEGGRSATDIHRRRSDVCGETFMYGSKVQHWWWNFEEDVQTFMI